MEEKESHGWRDFFIGLAIMIAFILFAYWAGGHNNVPDTVGNCISGTDSGAGC
jgi:hypothetical protein